MRRLHFSFARFLLFFAFLAASPFAHAEDNAAIATNATAETQRAIEAGAQRLALAVAARDGDALAIFGLRADAKNGALALQPRVVASAATPKGALVRIEYSATSDGNDDAPRTVKSGTLDLWMARSQMEGGEVFTPDGRRWIPPARDGRSDALQALAGAAADEWSDLKGGALLHLVAQKRGGRWIALRRSRWDGSILDNARLQKAQRAMQKSTPENGRTFVSAWLQTQMARWDNESAGIAHFVLQRGADNWVGLDAVWDADKKAATTGDKRVEKWRVSMSGDGFLSAAAHRDFAAALAQIGLYGEAADESEKAEALQENIIGAARLRAVSGLRARDPQALAAWQMANEGKIGIGKDHPIYVLNALAKQQAKQPTALGALQIGLEYSKLAQDARAASWLSYADKLIAGGALKTADQNEATWMGILHDQLGERRLYAGLKPPNVIRSGLFTLRCWPNDLNTVVILAALETAQHRVYADFGVPMGNTEVVLWRNQAEFQAYTTRVSGTATSEFIAALTLTKLVQAQDGPVVLSEEVNVFTERRGDAISTVAHEYGHVAVREVSLGRAVPMWLNEGIATAVEGGYDGYVPRVRAAAERGQLLSMNELLEWNVDGERAFLAYSQANSLIDFIVAKWGREAVLSILRQIGRDVSPETALRSVLKISSQELWNRWAREGIS